MLSTPPFIKPLIDQVKDEVIKIDKEYDVVTTEPDYSKKLGVTGNFSVTGIYSAEPMGMVTKNCVYVSHIVSCGVKYVVYNRASTSEDPDGSTMVMHYVEDDVMDGIELEASSGRNPAGVILTSRVSKMAKDIACFIFNGKRPSYKD